MEGLSFQSEPHRSFAQWILILDLVSKFDKILFQRRLFTTARWLRIVNIRKIINHDQAYITFVWIAIYRLDWIGCPFLSLLHMRAIVRFWTRRVVCKTKNSAGTQSPVDNTSFSALKCISKGRYNRPEPFFYIDVV